MWLFLAMALCSTAWAGPDVTPADEAEPLTALEHLDLAMTSFNEGDWIAARAHAESCIELNGTSATRDARGILVEVYLAEERVELATAEIKAIRAFTDLSPEESAWAARAAQRGEAQRLLAVGSVDAAVKIQVSIARNPFIGNRDQNWVRRMAGRVQVRRAELGASGPDVDAALAKWAADSASMPLEDTWIAAVNRRRKVQTDVDRCAFDEALATLDQIESPEGLQRADAGWAARVRERVVVMAMLNAGDPNEALRLIRARPAASGEEADWWAALGDLGMYRLYQKNGRPKDELESRLERFKRRRAAIPSCLVDSSPPPLGGSREPATEPGSKSTKEADGEGETEEREDEHKGPTGTLDPERDGMRLSAGADAGAALVGDSCEREAVESLGDCTGTWPPGLNDLPEGSQAWPVLGGWVEFEGAAFSTVRLRLEGAGRTASPFDGDDTAEAVPPAIHWRAQAALAFPVRLVQFEAGLGLRNILVPVHEFNGTKVALGDDETFLSRYRSSEQANFITPYLAAGVSGHFGSVVEVIPRLTVCGIYGLESTDQGAPSFVSIDLGVDGRTGSKRFQLLFGLSVEAEWARAVERYPGERDALANWWKGKGVPALPVDTHTRVGLTPLLRIGGSVSSLGGR